MPQAEDIRRLELKQTINGNHVSQRLVFKGTSIDVGHQVYDLHNRLCAVGYQVRVKTAHIGKIGGMGYPCYAVVTDINGSSVIIEELRTDPKDPAEGQGKQVSLNRDFFLEHYEVD